jgi:hypothetical protein
LHQSRKLDQKPIFRKLEKPRSNSTGPLALGQPKALADDMVLVQTLRKRTIGHWKESSVASGGQHSLPNVWSSSGSGWQLSRLELMFSNFLSKLDSADRYRSGLESLEPEHRPYPLFDSAMVLLDNIVQVLAGAYPNAAR